MPKTKMDDKAIAIANAKDQFLADVLADWVKFRVGESAKVAGITDAGKAAVFIAGNRGKAEYIRDEALTRIRQRSTDKPEPSKKAILFGPVTDTDSE